MTTQVNLSWDEVELGSVSSELGFDPSEWGWPAPKEDNDTHEDDWSKKDAVPSRCKSGEMWQLGDHRLLCGDSTKKEDVLRLMCGERADLWLTDPPYNVAVKNSKGMKIANDDMSSSKFYKFLHGAFMAAKGVLQDGAPFYVWFATSEYINFVSALASVGLSVKQELIWNKNSFTLGRSHYQWKHEPCLYGWAGKKCRYFIGSRNLATVLSEYDREDLSSLGEDDLRNLLLRIYSQDIPTSVIDESKPAKDSEHPTMKPVRLFGRQIVNSSKQGDIVLDTFGGSGTTIVACEQLGRKARLMELDPHYCDVIIARWEKLTGAEAFKL